MRCGIERAKKAGVIGESHAAGDARLVVRLRRQGLGLRVVEVLQAVLQIAQENIGRAQLGHGLVRQQAARCEQRQHRQRGAGLQRRHLAAADELEHLGDEFDLADAARPELDVVDAVAADDFAADLRVQFAHRGKAR